MKDNTINLDDFSNYSKKINKIEIFSDTQYIISNFPETLETLLLHGDNFIIKTLPKGLKYLKITRSCMNNHKDLKILYIYS